MNKSMDIHIAYIYGKSIREKIDTTVKETGKAN